MSDMPLPALATSQQADDLDLTVTEAALKRASTRVRAYTGQQISAGESTVTVTGPIARLPERPVTEVLEVVDAYGHAVPEGQWSLGAGGVLDLPTPGVFRVTYRHGYADGEYPDELVEVVCTIAARLVSTDPTIAAGVTQEQSGSASQTFGVDAWQGLGGLTREEKAVLARLFPRLPRSLVMRP